MPIDRELDEWQRYQSITQGSLTTGVIKMIENRKVDLMEINDAPALDPIRVITENYSPGAGRIIIQCHTRAWTGYWGAMGQRSIQQFFVDCDSSYLLGNLTTGYCGLMKAKEAKHDDAYLLRIIKAVQDAIRIVSDEMIPE